MTTVFQTQAMIRSNLKAGDTLNNLDVIEYVEDLVNAMDMRQDIKGFRN